jgi:hypothetical protein
LSKFADRTPSIPAEGSPLPLAIASEFLRYVELEEAGLSDSPAPEMTDANPGVSCLNCDGELECGLLYCDEFCKDMAKFVRYVRACRGDGRVAQSDIKEAIAIKLLMLHGGGYAEEERTLAPAERTAIFERDLHRCQLCGAPATQIDHIEGSSPEPSNLRAICGPCNLSRAFVNAREADDEEHEFIHRLWDDLTFRIAAPKPTRVCDDEKSWQREWRALSAASRRLQSPVK